MSLLPNAALKDCRFFVLVFPPLVCLSTNTYSIRPSCQLRQTSNVHPLLDLLKLILSDVHLKCGFFSLRHPQVLPLFVCMYLRPPHTPSCCRLHTCCNVLIFLDTHCSGLGNFSKILAALVGATSSWEVTLFVRTLPPECPVS